MKYPLFTQVKLQIDLPTFNLKKGAIGTIVEFYDLPIGQEPGYSLEGLIPNDTVEVSESSISALVQAPLFRTIDGRSRAGFSAGIGHRTRHSRYGRS